MLWQRIGIALGAGVAAALLFAVLAKGTLLAMALACLAPLPILIAGLCWGVDMGGLAAVAACAVAAALAGPLSGAAFGATIALPAWILSAVSQAPPLPLFWRTKADPTKTAGWFPVGGIVAIAALIGAATGLGALVSLIVAYGGYQKGVEAKVAEAAPILRQMLDETIALPLGVTTSLPAGVTVQDFATLVVQMSPMMLAAVSFLMFCGNLYAGARVAELSGALKRPWPNLPEALVLPQYLGVAFIVCLGLALAMGDPAEEAAWIGVAGLSGAFVLQGLASIHALTRGLRIRTPLLFAFYLVCALGWNVILPIVVPIVALAGLLECFLSLRARRVAAAANVKNVN